MNIHVPIRTRGDWSEAQETELRRLWEIHGGKVKTIARIMGMTPGMVSGKSRRLRLHFQGGKGVSLSPLSAPVKEARSIFHRRLRKPDRNALKSGDNQRKLGAKVTKGHWKGFSIFSLTLEERATGPRDCALWLSCYGNGMNRAARYEHGRPLEREIHEELAILQGKYPRGFIVRLHILGDFYSVAYVEFWRRQLVAFPALHVFGYSARQEGTSIGDAIAHLRRSQWARFAVRTSGAANGPRTIVIDTPDQASGAIVCPAQTGKTQCCATCGLCWATQKPIAFLRH